MSSKRADWCSLHMAIPCHSYLDLGQGSCNFKGFFNVFFCVSHIHGKAIAAWASSFGSEMNLLRSEPP